MKKIILSLLALILIAGVVSAQTADFLTPSVETVCDNQIGAAFGLCNAYCEAMDCHLDNPQASLAACPKVLDRYVRITGASPPCENACPCTVSVEFSDLVTGVSVIDSCEISTDYIEVISGDLVGAIDLGPPPECGVFSDDIDLHLEITEAQLDVCSNLLLDAIDAQNIECDEDDPGGPVS